MTAVKKQPISVAAVAVDIVIFSIEDKKLKVLLLQSKKGPFTGQWVIPGGLVAPKETLEQSVERHMLAKAGLKDVYFEQLYTFGRIDRDPRGRVVAVAYMILLPSNSFKPKTTSAYSEIKWFAAKNLPRLGYDHEEIIQNAVVRLKGKVGYTNIVYGLLPKEFSLSEIQKIYEAILSRALDKRNFRKKILSLGLLKKASGTTRGEAHRPAQLYSFVKRTPQIIEMI